MSIDQRDWDDGARASASTLFARAAAAARHADRRLAEAIEDFFLPEDSKLDDRTRAALAATLTAIVAAVERDLRRRAVAHSSGADSTAIQRIEDGAPVLDRLVGSGLLRDFDMMRELIARTRQDLLVDLLPALPPDEIGSASLLARLAGSADPRVADAALAVMAAESRRRGLIDSHRLERTELPAELQHRLVWWVAAAIREQLGPSAADRIIAEVALRALADHDEGDRLESAAMRLAATVDPQPAELATVLRHALGDRRVALVIAFLGHALGIDYATMRQIVLDGGDQLWLALRGAGLDRATVARVGLSLCEADPRRDVEAFADQLEAIAAVTPDEARGALAPLRLHPDFRAAMAELEKRR
ncbi:DUF2336 domain-containing protein [Sphingomonas sp.]|uniref:DUF2336 domain-containing protein n=1 Tax=Sphingomonas sp. TaxID=28214 RepID=UPI0025DB3536|nr:DUF2336 domain-containing protein [Sphingomonas sp.]